MKTWKLGRNRQARNGEKEGEECHGRENCMQGVKEASMELKQASATEAPVSLEADSSVEDGTVPQRLAAHPRGLDLTCRAS